MRVLVRRARRRLVLATSLLVLAAAAPSCRAKGNTTTPKYLGDFRGAPTEVPPEFEAPWADLQAALKRDPANADVDAAADRLLAAGPPFDLRLWGVQAKAAHAYAIGDDARAIQMADEVLTAAAGRSDASADAISALCLVRVRSMVRSGDPARALILIEEPPLQREGVIVPDEDAALRAIAFDRSGRHPEALAAFVRWRSRIDVDDAAAAYAERRAAALATSLGRAAVVEVAQSQKESTRQCLDALAGALPPSDAPAWVQRCRAAPTKIGILLPRSGPLSALADTQLAAAAIAIDLLAQDNPQIGDVLWRDSGSEAGTSADGAAALVADGATVIVGPVGAANVRAAKGRVGMAARMITPGEPVAEVTGAAPTLETRVAALVDVALQRGAEKLIVLVPDSGYGKRASQAASKRAEKTKLKSPQIVTYPADTTSFAEVLGPLGKSLSSKTAVIIGDHVTRTEMLVRQLARDGKGPSAPKGPLVLATAEGISDTEASVGHDILAGLFVAPTAVATPDVTRFVDAYTKAEGTAPPDQALLVFRALAIAFAGSASTSAPAVIVRVEGGHLVVQSPSS